MNPNAIPSRAAMISNTSSLTSGETPAGGKRPSSDQRQAPVAGHPFDVDAAEFRSSKRNRVYRRKFAYGEARRLFALGVDVNEIAERMGVHRVTIRRACDIAVYENMRAHVDHDQRQGICPDCGGPKSKGRRAVRCRSCMLHGGGSGPGPKRGFDHDEALRLRRSGWTTQRIADHFGVTHRAARSAIERLKAAAPLGRSEDTR